MTRDGIVGLLLVLLLGGFVLLTRKPVASMAVSSSPCSTCGPRMVAEPARYRNKETRKIEYNDDGLPTLIEITRDYTVA